MSKKKHVKRNRCFTGSLYRMPEDHMAGRSQKAWEALGCKLKRTAEGFKCFGQLLYFPHEVHLPKELRF
jgi:hypothetical protein